LPVLKNFENVIDPIILKRGKSYYKNGSVLELDEVDDGEFRATIEGTYPYEVQLTIKNGSIVEHLCSCPYDFGEYCKHEVALMHSVREYLENDTDKNEHSVGHKRTTIKEEVESILNSISPMDLRSLVVEQAKKDKKFRSKLLRLAPIKPGSQKNDCKDIYKGRIQDCIESASDRGYVGYWEASQAAEAGEEIMQEAEENIKNGDFATAILMAQATLEEVYPALERVDDSNGEFGCLLDQAWEILNKCFDNIDVNSSLSKELFNYCVKEARKDKYQGWDVDRDFYELASHLVYDKKTQEELFQALDKNLEKKESLSKEYSERVFTEIKIAVLKRLNKNQEAQKIITSNLHIPEIRKTLIEQCFNKKDYLQSKKLAQEGLALAKSNNHCGIENDFLQWLLKIAETEKDINTVKKYLKLFFLEKSEGNFEYYDQLKKTCSQPSEWEEEVEKIIIHFSKNRFSIYILPDIYIREKRWDDFLATIENECGKKEEHFNHDRILNLLDHYHKNLATHFPKQLVRLYADAIENSLKGWARGRNHYMYICRFLRRIKKLGQLEKAKEMKNQFKEQYRNRKALLEELDKI